MGEHITADGEGAVAWVSRAACQPHSFAVQPAGGPTSDGHCVLCGETRVFRNTIPVAWENVNPNRRGDKRGYSVQKQRAGDAGGVPAQDADGVRETA
jgi:hypothetical protein